MLDAQLNLTKLETTALQEKCTALEVSTITLAFVLTVEPLSKLETNGSDKSSEVSACTRVVLGVGKGVLFRYVSSVQRGSTVYNS